MIKVQLTRNGVTDSYPVAYLDYERLIQFDPSVEQYFSEAEINASGTLAYAQSTYGPDANIKIYRVARGGGGAVDLGVTSPYLNYCMSDVIKPSNLDPSVKRLCDFLDFETGKPLDEGQLVSQSFGPETTYPVSGPPSDIVTNCVWFREYKLNGITPWYDLKHQLQVDPDTQQTYPIQRNNYISADFRTSTGNVIGCCKGIMPTGGAYTYVSTECKQYYQPGDSLYAYDFSFGAAVQGDRVSGFMAPIPPFSAVPSNNWHSVATGSSPYIYDEEAGYNIAVVRRDTSIQCVYTNIDGKAYMGFCAFSFSGDSIQSIQMNLYPLWFWGNVFGTPEAPGSSEVVPEPIWEGPDANPQNTQGTYYITQVPAGEGGESSSILPFANLSANDPGLHIYVLDAGAVSDVYKDFWGSRYDVEKLAAGVVRFGIIPYEFIPPMSGTGAMQSLPSISYSHFTCSLSQGSHAYYANPYTIRKIDIATWDSNSGLERTWGNYLDFEPYTSITLTVPYCGSIQIPPSKCIGGSISVSMWCNIISGDVVSVIKCFSNSAIKTADGILGDEFETTYFMTGNCFVDVPIAMTSSGAKQALSLVGQIAGTAIAAGLYAAKGQFISSALQLGSIGGTLAEAPSSIKPEVSMQGGTPGINLINNHEFILEIARPAELADGNYKQISGTQSYLARKLSDVTGYTQCLQVLRTDTAVKIGQNTQILSFSGTPTELSEIKRILQDGVVL